jgi:hypothetical protein
MCPACIATMTFLIAGSASTGGLTAVMAKKFCRKSDAKTAAPNQEKFRKSQIKPDIRERCGASVDNIQISGSDRVEAFAQRAVD